MEHATLGGSDLDASAVTMGLWNVAGGVTWGESARAEAHAAIDAAIDAGITTFDTAEAYGDGTSERLLGEAIADRDREDLQIATKAWTDNHRAGDLKTACRASLDRLGTDYVDLYYLHYPNDEVPFAETFGALAELREEGLIREVGVSNFGVDQLREAREASPVPIVANQLPYSLLWRAIEFGVREACLDSDVSIVAYSPLAQGLLADAYDSPEGVPDGVARTRLFSGDRPHARHGEEGVEELTFETLDRIRSISADAGRPMAEVALAWVLDRVGVASAVAGSTTPEHVRGNAAAAGVGLDREVVDRLNAATEELRAALGPNPDPWQSDSRYR
jgi:aryl-alcohol dehydrogenase-like predicted oxidoreductase